MGNQPYITGLSGLTNLSVSGNVTANIVIVGDAGGVFWSNGSTALGGSGGGYGNTQVAQYLPVYTGNIGATITDTTQPYITQVGTLTSLDATTAVVTNFSSGNIRVSGGYISALTNATVTTASLTNLTSTTTVTTNFSTGNASITGGYINNLANLTATTAQATNFSTGNARITGGYADNFPIGANTAATGRFTTIISTTVNAGTIGNIIQFICNWKCQCW